MKVEEAEAEGVLQVQVQLSSLLVPEVVVEVPAEPSRWSSE